MNDARLQVRGLALKQPGSISNRPRMAIPISITLTIKATTGVFDLTGARRAPVPGLCRFQRSVRPQAGQVPGHQPDHSQRRGQRHADLPGCRNLPPVRARSNRPAWLPPGCGTSRMATFPSTWTVNRIVRRAACPVRSSSWNRIRPEMKRIVPPEQSNPGQRYETLVHRRDRLRATGKALPAFKWTCALLNRLSRRTPLYEIHKALGAKMVPFAGWEMPVWYTSVLEEHLATRQAAGLFDVSHMGVYQVEGDDAASFLDSVCANVGRLAPAGRIALHPLPRPGRQRHRRHPGLPAHGGQIPDGGQCLQRRQGPGLAGSRPGRQGQDR